MGDYPAGFVQEIAVDAQLRVCRARLGNKEAGRIAANGDEEEAARDDGLAIERQQERTDGDGFAKRFHDNQKAAGDGADEDGDEGCRLDEAVSADQFVLAQVVGQDRILERAEEGRLRPHQEQHRQQGIDLEGQIVRMQEKAHRRKAHNKDFRELDFLDQAGFFVFIGELAGCGGEEEEGDHQKAAGHGNDDLVALVAEAGRHVGGAEDNQENQGVLEEVVVERAQELRHEQRQKAAGLQKVSQVRLHWRFNSRMPACL